MVAWFVLVLILAVVFIAALVTLTVFNVQNNKRVEEEYKNELEQILEELERNIEEN